MDTHMTAVQWQARGYRLPFHSLMNPKIRKSKSEREESEE